MNRTEKRFEDVSLGAALLILGKSFNCLTPISSSLNRIEKVDYLRPML